MTETNQSRHATSRVLHVGVGVFLTLVCLWALSPLVESSWSSILNTKALYPRAWFTVESDIWLTTWVLSWDAHILTTDPLSLFQANALYPTPDVLARSEHMLGMLVAYAPAYYLTGNAIFSLQTTLFASFVLSSISMYALLRHCGCGVAISVFGGLLWSFLPWRLHDGLGRMHLLQYQYLPLVILFLDRLMTSSRSLKDVAGFAAFLLLQSLTTYHHAYFSYLCVGAVLVVHLMLGTLRGRWRALVESVAAALAVAIVMAALSLPYLALSKEGGFGMSAHQMWVHNQVNVASAATYVARPYFLPWLTWVSLAASLYIFGALLVGRARHDARVRVGLILAVVAIAGVTLSFGSGSANLKMFGGKGFGRFLQALSLPYELATATVPGFRHLRDPYRFLALASVGIVGTAALGADLFVRTTIGRWRPVGAALSICAAGLMCWHLSTVSVPLVDVSAELKPRPEYRWLSNNAEGLPILELPLSRARVDAFIDARYMYYSTFHWLPLINGFTGHMPKHYGHVRRLVADLPDSEALAELHRRTGVGWIVDHRQFAFDSRRAWHRSPALREAAHFGDTIVWRVELSGAPPG